MALQIDAVFDEATFTVSYLILDTQTKTAALLDSVLDYDPASGTVSTGNAEKLLALAEAAGAKVAYILETHVHADHMSGAQVLKQRTGAPVCIGDHVTIVQETFRDLYNLGADFPCDGSQFDRLLHDGECLPLGALEIEVMHLPGHTPACVAYRVGDAVFTGDTIFSPDFGSARCDFPGGDARKLYHSVRRMLDLPPETRLFLCHDYAPGGRDFLWETSVAEQRADNLHIKDGVDEETFVRFRTDRDAQLTMPALILPSVQVNIRAGHLPEAEGNGVSYLKVPITQS